MKRFERFVLWVLAPGAAIVGLYVRGGHYILRPTHIALLLVAYVLLLRWVWKSEDRRERWQARAERAETELASIDRTLDKAIEKMDATTRRLNRLTGIERDRETPGSG